jgi:hypothetical protein
VHEWLVWLESTAVSTWVRESGSLWAYPMVLTAHTVGMSLLVGASAVIDLRLLGAAPLVPRGPLAVVFRALWTGAAISLVSGLLLFGADASTKGATAVFFVKLAFIAAGLVVAWRLTRVFAGIGSGAIADVEAAPGRTRLLAVLSLLLWTAAITAGRFMAYLTPEPF